MDISIVVPIFNEEKNINILYTELYKVLSTNGYQFEIIFVDDGSKDQSIEVIRGLSQQFNSVKCISLSRNFGHQIALTAGLHAAKGEVVITMDGDLQHPPSVIIEMLSKYDEGYDIVNTIRISNKSESAFKRITSKGFYKVLNFLSDVHIESASSDFRLMNRKTVNAFLTIDEKDRFTRGLVSWLGYKQAFLPYLADKRYAGSTKFSLKKMIHFAFDGITSFSSKPLRISFYVGVVISFTSLLYALYAISSFFEGKNVPGWTSILISVLFIGGIQLISIGIVGEYLARVYNQSKNRPLYLINEIIESKEL
jgi:glycosyltransferase involved in cell wall biosynthesis